MENVDFRIKKSVVFEDVDRTTAYIGAKTPDTEGGVFDLVSTADEDREMLDRFWMEACSIATTKLSNHVVSVGEQPVESALDMERDYVVELAPDEKFKPVLVDSIKTLLHQFFVKFIIAKWFMLVGHKLAESYMIEAMSYLEETTHRTSLKIVKRPTRPF